MKVNISKQIRKVKVNKFLKLNKEIEELNFKRYYIKYSWKHGYPKGNSKYWESWRSFAIVPILFITKEEAETYLSKVGFFNMGHLKKCTASIEVKWLNR